MSKSKQQIVITNNNYKLEYNPETDTGSLRELSTGQEIALTEQTMSDIDLLLTAVMVERGYDMPPLDETSNEFPQLYSGDSGGWS